MRARRRLYTVYFIKQCNFRLSLYKIGNVRNQQTTQYNYLQTIYKCAQGEDLQPWLSTEIRKQCVLHWSLCEEMFANSLELQTGTLVLLYNLLALARRQLRDQRVGTRFSRLWSAGTP